MTSSYVIIPIKLLLFLLGLVVEVSLKKHGMYLLTVSWTKYWPIQKYVTILWLKSFTYSMEFQSEAFMSLADDKSTLDDLVSWDNKPLAKPMLTKIHDAIWIHLSPVM